MNILNNLREIMNYMDIQVYLYIEKLKLTINNAIFPNTCN